MKRTNDHLHGPDNTKVSCFETKIGIKRRAQTTHETSHHIIGDSVLELSEGTSANLPGGTFREPLFPVKFWNHHLEVPQGFPKKQPILLKHGTVLTMLLSVAIIQTYGD